MTNSIFSLSVYENNLTNKKIVRCDCSLCQDDGEQKAARLINLVVNILLLNDLFKIIKNTKNFYCNISGSLSFCFLKNGGFIKFIFMFWLLMLILSRGISIKGIYKIIRSKILETQLYNYKAGFLYLFV